MVRSKGTLKRSSHRFVVLLLCRRSGKGIYPFSKSIASEWAALAQVVISSRFTAANLGIGRLQLLEQFLVFFLFLFRQMTLLVGMVLQAQLSVSSSHIVLGGGAAYAQHRVRILVSRVVAASSVRCVACDEENNKKETDKSASHPD